MDLPLEDSKAGPGAGQQQSLEFCLASVQAAGAGETVAHGSSLARGVRMCIVAAGRRPMGH